MSEHPDPEPRIEARSLTERCSRDTNGDGDCGQIACPECGPHAEQIARIQRESDTSMTSTSDKNKSTAPDSNGVPVDLFEDGILWLLNTTVFHPRGFALGADLATKALSLYGNGTEPCQYLVKEQAPDDPNAIDSHAKFEAVRNLFERAARENTL